MRAVHALQRAVRDGADRFLFEMATGTGKTLTAAAVIKLFLRTGNARRVLFLVDRLELEEQARGVFTELLSKDFRTVVYKENRNDWSSAEIVVSTVQSLLFDNKYQRLFSPTDFIQIKGRGTRLHDFRDHLFDKDLAEGIERPEKTAFKLFDFFGNNEYFEEDFNYDEVLQLPAGHSENGNGGEVDPVESVGVYEHAGGDTLYSIRQETVGYQGMKIDRMFFDRFADTVREDAVIAEAVEAEQWDRAVDHVSRHLFERPEDYFNLAKLRRAVDADRRLSLREILEHVFERFKTMDELLDEEFAKFIADRQPGEPAHLPALRSYFKAYAADERTRRIIEDRKYTDLDTNPTFTLNDFIGIPDEYRTIIPEYIKDYVSINQFVS